MVSPTPAEPSRGGRLPELHLTLEMNSNRVDVAVKLAGELDAATSPWLVDRLERTLGPHASRLTLDLSEVTFLDVAGVRALVTLGDRARRADGVLEVRGLREGPERLARLLGLDHSVTLKPEN